MADLIASDVIDALGALDRTLLHVFVAGPGEGEGVAVALPERGWIVVDGCRSVTGLPLSAILRKWRSSAADPIIAFVFNWDRLTRFLRDARIPLDNNATERGIRGPVVGRKNHYGSKSRRGTEIAAVFYTLLETAKLHGIDPGRYLREAALADSRGEVLLPQDGVDCPFRVQAAVGHRIISP